jgi:hypothetical protein
MKMPTKEMMEREDQSEPLLERTSRRKGCFFSNEKMKTRPPAFSVMALSSRGYGNVDIVLGTVFVVFLVSLFIVTPTFPMDRKISTLDDDSLVALAKEDKHSSVTDAEVTPTPLTTAQTVSASLSITTSAYVHPNDKPYEPPAWIKDYIEFHRSKVKDGVLAEDTQWIEWYCAYDRYDKLKNKSIRHCGGLADRIKGIQQSLLLGIVTNRVSLLEEWEVPAHPLTTFLEPNLIDWTARPKNVNDVEHVHAYKLRPVNQPELANAIHDDICSFAVPKNTSDWTNHFQGIRYTGKYCTRQPAIARAKCLHNLGHPKGTIKSDRNIKRTLFWTLFRFSAATSELANQLRSPRISKPDYYIAAHIRTGDGADFEDHLKDHTETSWEEYSQCITIMQDAMQTQCGGGTSHRPPVYLASDSDMAKAYIQKQHPEVQIGSVEIEHVDKPGEQNHTAAFGAAMAEFKILTDSTCLIFHTSGFSRLARDFSRLEPRCAIELPNCKEPGKVRKAVANIPCPAKM